MDTLAQSLEGKYEILSKIKEGGMGAIYLVRHRLLGELRVIKIMKAEVAESEEQQKRFFREAQTATRLRHPNITTFYDFVLGEDGTAYMVMEFVDGINVHELLESQGPTPVALAMELSRQSLSALGYLHRKGVIHRDISPDNIMVTHDDQGLPEVKLIDLGIAKMANSQSELTAADVFVGKLRYCSPEHLNGGPAARSLDARSDLYSFGVVLYEMLTGKLPFVGDSVQALVASQLFRPPTPIEESDPHGLVPPALRQVVMRSLQKKPEDRYQSAEEFTRALEAAFPVVTSAETRAAMSQYIAPALQKSPVSRLVTSTGASAQRVIDQKFGQWTTKTLPMSGRMPREEGAATEGTRILGTPEPATSPGLTARGARPSASPTVVLAGAGALPQPAAPPASRKNPLLIPSLAALGVAVAAIAWLLLRPRPAQIVSGPTSHPVGAPSVSTTAPPPATTAASVSAVPAASPGPRAAPPAPAEAVAPKIRENAGNAEKNERRETRRSEAAALRPAEPDQPVEKRASIAPPIAPAPPPISEPAVKYCVNILPTSFTQGVTQEKPRGFAGDADAFVAPRPDIGRIRIRITVHPDSPVTNQNFSVVAQLVNGGDLPLTVRLAEESAPRVKGAFVPLNTVNLPARVDSGDTLTFYEFSGSLTGKFIKDLRLTDTKGNQWSSQVRVEPCD